MKPYRYKTNRSNNSVKLSSLHKNAKKLSLISKLSSALKVKYKKLFLALGYDDKDLYADINNFLTTKYQSQLPKEVFIPVEEEIIQKLKNKGGTAVNTNRSVPKTKVIHNKSNEKELRQSLQTEPLKNVGKKKKESKENLVIQTENSQKTKEKETDNNNFATEPHELVDKLRLKMENDHHAKYLREQNQKYLEEEKKLQNKKIEQQKEIFEYLQKQIEEKQKNKKKEEEEENKRLLAYQEKEMQKWQEDLQAKKALRQKQITEFQKSFELYEKEKKEQALKEQSLFTVNPNGYFNDDNSLMKKKQFQENFKKDCIKFEAEKDEYLRQEKERKRKEEELYKKQCEEVAKHQNDLNNFMKQKVLARVRSQEKIEEIMKKIFDGQKKAENLKYIKEREEQEQKKKLELEKEDMKRKQKIEEMKKSLDFYMDYKQKEKEKQKQLELQYREKANKLYNDYLIEESDKKRQKEEKIRKYRQELDQQIKENKKRINDELILSYKPITISKSQKVISEEEDKQLVKSIQ